MNISSTLNKTLYELVDIHSVEDHCHTNMWDLQIEDDESFCLSNGILSHNSATSAFIDVRDVNKHGAYPLKGVPMNSYGASPLAILKNKEYSDICSILNLTIGKPPTNLNYDTIRIMTDADHDGIHIRGLLISFFSMWMDLFKQNRIEIVTAPIIIAKKGKKKNKYYSFQEYELAKQKLSGFSIEYYKGLGTFEIEDYTDLINNPVTYIVDLDDVSKLDLLFSDNVEERKKWLMA